LKITDMCIISIVFVMVVYSTEFGNAENLENRSLIS